MYELKDTYYRKAKKEGLASRAAYKLIQINKKFYIIKKGQSVLDLGCSPGGFLQVLLDEVGPGGRIIALDRRPLSIPIRENVRFILGDFFSEDVVESLVSSCGRGVHVIISDMAPDLTGVKFKDAHESTMIADKVLDVCDIILLPGGNLCLKVFYSDEIKELMERVGKGFKKVSRYVPQASRKGSSEVYIIGKGYVGKG